MNEQIEGIPSERGVGRPRKQRVEAVAPVAFPADPVSPLVTDRRGAAKMLGKSVSTVKRLEQSDPDWPRTFPVGASEHNYLIEAVRTYIMRKARVDAAA